MKINKKRRNIFDCSIEKRFGKDRLKSSLKREVVKNVDMVAAFTETLDFQVPVNPDIHRGISRIVRVFAEYKMIQSIG